MKVVFLETLTGVASVGDIKEVKPGFLRNFLLPNGIAIPASKEIIEETKEIRNEQEQIKKAKIDLAIEKKDAISGHIVEFKVKADGVNLYAAITEKDIMDKINETFGLELDKRLIKNAKFKTLGDYPVLINLGEGINVGITVKIIGEGVPEEKTKKGRKSTAEKKSEGTGEDGEKKEEVKKGRKSKKTDETNEEEINEVVS